MNPSVMASCVLTPKLEAFLRRRPETPCLAIDLDVVARKYGELHACFARAALHYPVRANPTPEVIARLALIGSHFDVGSRTELEVCLAHGVDPARISFGHPIKRSNDIAYAFDRGVRCFGFDSDVELDKIARHAPGAGVFCRLLIAEPPTDWPRWGKFGCVGDMACDLIRRSRASGLAPLGLAFHLGSQQIDPSSWRAALLEAAELYRQLARGGIDLPMINIGGGLPAPYRGRIASLDRYAGAIHRALADAFGLSCPQVLIEPGRALVADAGVIQTEILLVARKSRESETRWMYLDIGRYGGLAETADEFIRYRLRSARSGPTGPVILAGPTCDSSDILYAHLPYDLPWSLETGDRLDILGAGAYTSSYASSFNGVMPLTTYCL